VPMRSETSPDQLVLEFKELQKTFDPKEVYGDVPNPTVL
jgi:phosphoribosyl-AMP cyclohydrolase